MTLSNDDAAAPNAPPNALRALLGEGAISTPQPRVLQLLDERAQDLANAVRRGVPPLLRKGIPVEAKPARLMKSAAALEELKEPWFQVPLATDPGGSRAMIALDAGAISYLLDAAFGGDLDESAPIHACDLTAPQRAALGRLVDPIVKLVSDVLAGLGIRLRRLPVSSGPPGEGELACLTLSIGSRKERNIVLAFARDALSAGGGPLLGSKRDVGEERVTAILSQVELDLVAELGRVRKRVSDIGSFKVGDVLRLDTPIRAPIVIRVQGRPILTGRPTTSGSQLAISVVDKLGSNNGTASTPRVETISIRPAMSVPAPPPFLEARDV